MPLDSVTALDVIKTLNVFKNWEPKEDIVEALSEALIQFQPAFKDAIVEFPGLSNAIEKLKIAPIELLKGPTTELVTEVVKAVTKQKTTTLKLRSETVKNVIKKVPLDPLFGHFCK